MSGGKVSVWLEGFHADVQDEAAPRLAEAFGIDLEAAHALIGRAPTPVKRVATDEQASEYLAALESIGARTSIRSPMFDASTTEAPPTRAALGPPTTRVRHGQVCVDHPDEVAVFYCPQCALSRCADCVTPSGEGASCRRCSAPTEKYVEPFAVLTLTDYIRELPKSALFAFRKDVLFLLIGTAILVWPISAMAAMPGNMYSVIGLGIQFALESALLLHLIRQVARDVSDIDPPDFTDVFDDLVIPTWRYLFACLPMIAAVLWAAVIVLDDIFLVSKLEPHQVIDVSGPRWLFLGGFIIWPITSLLAAMSSSILSVLNPINWVQTARSIGAPLLLGAPAFYAIVLIEAYVLLPLSGMLLEISVVGRLLALFVFYIALAVRARLLGALIIGRI